MGSSIRVALVLLAVALLCHCSDNPTKPIKPNKPPLLASVGPQSVQEGARLEFLVQATDSDGAIPTLSARNLPTNATAIDSGNGKLLFVFEPDLTQSGLYYVTFIASDGRLTDSQTVTITVTPYSVGELWPMAVGNYWIYEIKDWYGLRTDSVQVVSTYQSNGETHWVFSQEMFCERYVRREIWFCGDTTVIAPRRIVAPDVWPDRADTVPAGIFISTYECLYPDWRLQPWETFVFAKSVGLIKYEWFSGSAHYPAWYTARLLRYRVK
jgi:hypothetical protein